MCFKVSTSQSVLRLHDASKLCALKCGRQKLAGLALEASCHLAIGPLYDKPVSQAQLPVCRRLTRSRKEGRFGQLSATAVYVRTARFPRRSSRELRHLLRYGEGLDEGMREVLLDSKPVRRLTIFGIALPLGVISASRELERRNWAAPDLIAWITIVAGFWWIAGMFVTGVYLIRDAIRRHGQPFVSEQEDCVALPKGR